MSRRRTAPRLLLATAGLAALAGCSLLDGEERLEGERIRIRENRADVVASSDSTALGFGLEGTAQGGAPLPPPQPIDDWTQTNANATHNAGHLSGPTRLERVWTTDVGEGASDDGAITSAPIVVDGRVYALDAAASVTALDAGSGTERWRTALAPEGEDGSEGFGGGLAAAGGRLFATTGFGEVLALDPGSGEILWRTRTGAPIRSAPAAAGDSVVAVARDNRAFALDAATGEIRWRTQAASSGAALLGGASPALAGGGALIPFGSGELIAVELSTGRRAWSAVISGGRRGLARATIADVTGDPVVVGPFVVAANQAGRIVAVAGQNGRRAWTRSLGATGPIWAADNTLFLVTDAAQLVRLNAASGATVWSTDLPAFEDPEDREDPITYSGPVLVEGRILVTSSLGELLVFDGVAGQAVKTVELGGGSVTGPVVADGTVYVLTDDAVLEAYR
ncbi:MAG: PQQ-binding-like beta-propeller repeat protein [Pseudomonadota bacterium]